VNLVNGDYHLQAGSPVIDKGDNDAPGLPATDSSYLSSGSMFEPSTDARRPRACTDRRTSKACGCGYFSSNPMPVMVEDNRQLRGEKKLLRGKLWDSGPHSFGLSATGVAHECRCRPGRLADAHRTPPGDTP
jgi:hypothetical protein